MSGGWRRNTRSPIGRQNGTSRWRRRAMAPRRQAIPVTDQAMTDRAARRARLRYLAPKETTPLLSEWDVRWDDIINFAGLILLLATIVILWLLARQLYGGEP